jgi:PAS domain S-box-containing protein
VWFFKDKQQRAMSGGLQKDSSVSSDFILGAIEDGVVMVNSDNIIHLFNPAASTITGWPAAEAIGLDYHSVLPLLDEKGQPMAPANHPFARVLATGKAVRDSNAVLATRTSKQVPISLIASPVLGEDGQNTQSVIGVFRDIAKEKEEEARRSEFISTASHEMRTPLAAIEGYLSLALNERISKVDPNAKKYLEKASTAVKHLGVLFADLLTSSRAEDGRLVSYPIVVEIGEVVQQIAEAERFHAKEKNLDLRFVLSSDKDITGGRVVRPAYYVYADPHRIAEVLQNLIDNAIKYTMSGTVTVRLTGDSSIVQIQVQDTGMGIPAEDIPHLFQKFYRVDNSSTRIIGGTGLGLFICRKIVELYQGRIWVESQQGKGSTFFINLPRLSTEQALEMQKKQASIVSPLNSSDMLK